MDDFASKFYIFFVEVKMQIQVTYCCLYEICCNKYFLNKFNEIVTFFKVNFGIKNFLAYLKIIFFLHSNLITFDVNAEKR